MSASTFIVKYDGHALRDHEMDVRLLAPALMAMAKLVEDITKITSNGVGAATLSVKGNIKTGSIWVDLTVATSLLSNLKDLFNGHTLTAVLNAAEVVGLMAVLVAAIRKYRGQLPNKVSDGDQGDKTLEFDNETISMPVNVYNLYVNVDVRQNIYNILQPLESDGIDTFSAGNDICVTKAELPYFYPPRIEKTLHDNTQELTVIIESIVFKENNKWRFNNGTLSFSAAILDKDFLAQVDNGQRFAKGDWLRVQLQTVQIDENNTLKSIYNIVKVIKHETREQTKMQV